MKHSASELHIIQRNIIGEMKTQLSFILSNTLDIKREESLSSKGFSKLEIIKNTILNLLKYINLIENTVYEKASPSKKHIFNIFDFIAEIANSINNFIGGYNGIEIVCSTKLNKSLNVYSSTPELEYTLCSLISFLMKNFKDDSKKQVKISLSKNTDDKEFSISLTAEGFPLSQRHADLLGNKEYVSEFSGFEEMNICVLNINSKLLNGSVSYKRTKTRNKFVLTLPSEIPAIPEKQTTRANEYSHTCDIQLISALFSEFTDKY